MKRRRDMKKLEIGCGKPAGANVGEKRKDPDIPREKEIGMMARVGGKAPDFEAPAFHQGGFGQVKLSDYLNRWVCLCFYPGDFTFV